MTESWRQVFPAELHDKFSFAETRDASAIMQATEPEAFDDLVRVLEGFRLDADIIFRPGGSKSKIADDLDRAFRVLGWREAKYRQQLTTQLEVFPWKEGPAQESVTFEEEIADAEGHKIDCVKGRAAVDIEWNPKDGNLDRDIANYVALHTGGMLGVGVMLLRSEDLREPARDVIARIRSFDKKIDPFEMTTSWIYRVQQTPIDPYKTSTTANFEKLVPRLQRGDGQGCPILAIGLGWSSFVGSTEPIDQVAARIARLSEPRVPKDRIDGYEVELANRRRAFEEGTAPSRS